jgi:hypothetical protein
MHFSRCVLSYDKEQALVAIDSPDTQQETEYASHRKKAQSNFDIRADCHTVRLHDSEIGIAPIQATRALRTARCTSRQQAASLSALTSRPAVVIPHEKL